jgi:hypothetical protein
VQGKMQRQFDSQCFLLCEPATHRKPSPWLTDP